MLAAQVSKESGTSWQVAAQNETLLAERCELRGIR